MLRFLEMAYVRARDSSFQRELYEILTEPPALTYPPMPIDRFPLAIDAASYVKTYDDSMQKLRETNHAPPLTPGQQHALNQTRRKFRRARAHLALLQKEPSLLMLRTRASLVAQLLKAGESTAHNYPGPLLDNLRLQYAYFAQARMLSREAAPTLTLPQEQRLHQRLEVLQREILRVKVGQ